MTLKRSLFQHLTDHDDNLLVKTGTIPLSYTLVESKSSPRGVIIATYKRAGEVKTGTF